MRDNMEKELRLAVIRKRLEDKGYDESLVEEETERVAKLRQAYLDERYHFNSLYAEAQNEAMKEILSDGDFKYREELFNNEIKSSYLALRSKYLLYYYRSLDLEYLKEVFTAKKLSDIEVRNLEFKENAKLIKDNMFSGKDVKVHCDIKRKKVK